MKPPKNIAVIGGGPSGLMAAEMLATAGHRVTVYDRMPHPGRKFLMAGRGGLNLTHSEPLETFISRYGAAAQWLAPSLRAFTPDDLRAWCEGLGEPTFTGSSGRVFPKSMKAAPLLRAWLKRLEGLGVKYAARHVWQGCNGATPYFLGAAGEHADATLLALGGASWPRLGADGSWTGIVSQWGVALAPLCPANGGFIVPWTEHFSGRFAGEPLKPVMLTHAGVSRQGEAMITASGLEGGVVYALSAHLRDAVEKRGEALVHIDLRPDMSLDALTQKLDAPRGSKSLSNHLRNARFSPLHIGLLRETAPDAAGLAPAALAARLKALPLTLTAIAPIARAISTAGGIKRDAVDDNFMLRARPGVFAAGEMLDWEAPTGGYLLQGCFSTAVAAARGIIQYLAEN